ncbi:MAG: SPASM domain-containing protein [Elusimicrobiales bacterium]|nr:SPASM domain-containing protein [Elusimicrobiales bacterium]
MVYKSYADYRTAWSIAPTEKPPIPLNIDIELSAVCNLKCPFCFTQNKNYKQKNKFMPLNLAKSIIDQASDIGVPALKFNWRGESTIHPEFSTILEYAKSKGTFYDLLVNTNGNYISDAIDGLLSATKVIFSVDSFEPETYEKMRKGGDLKLLLKNIEELKNHNIILSRVITKSNKNEDFKGKAKELFGNIEIREHYVFERSKEVKTAIKRVYCGYPSQRLVISIDGGFYPCCVDYFETMKLGNFCQNSIMNIWESKQLNKIISGLKKNIFSNQCKKCTSWISYVNKKREALIK